MTRTAIPPRRSRKRAPTARPRASALTAAARRVLSDAERVTCHHGCPPGACVSEIVRALVAPIRTALRTP